MNIKVFHQGMGNNGQLWFSSFDGTSWGSGDKLVAGLFTDSPAPVVYRGKLFVYHQGSGRSGQLWVWDGSQDRLIPNVGISASPSAVEYNGRLFVFHQGLGNSGDLWYSTSTDGVNFSQDEQVPKVGIGNGTSNQPDALPTSPSAVVYRNFLYVFHQGLRAGGGNSGELWYSLWDGTKWFPDEKVGGVGMSSSPSAVVYQGHLWVLHQGFGNNGELWWVVLDVLNDGQLIGFAVDQKIGGVGMSTSPSTLVVRDQRGNDNLYVFHQGLGNSGQLWFSVFDGLGWGTDFQVANVGMSSSPGCVNQ